MGDARTGPDGDTTTQNPAITMMAWVAAGALVLGVAPLIRAQVPLSDELDLGSIILPWWTLVQLTVLASLLRLLSPRASAWSMGRRRLVASGLGVVVLLMSPSVLSLVSSIFGDDLERLSRDQLQIALLWSTPLLFYAVPAAVVVWMWLRRGRFTIGRSVGVAALTMALANLAAIFWFTFLWERYVRTGG